MQGSFALGQKRDSLPNVTVQSNKYVSVAKSVLPVQRIVREDISRLNAQSVGEAAKFFSGVLVKDYGGVGGLKTINVRSLGASHTALMYDGVPVSDVQAGQIDFSKYSLQNVESIELFSGQLSELLLPAKSFAYASVINVKTISNLQSRRQLSSASIRAGSFGFLEASPAISYKMGKNVFASLNGMWQQYNGHYPYKAFPSSKQKDYRLNDGVKTTKAEADVYYYFNDSNKVSIKFFGLNNRRYLPGSVFATLPNERLTDKEFFIQSSWRKHFNTKDKILLNAKYSNAYTYYLDPDYPNAAGKMENTYRQKEVFTSIAWQRQFSKRLSAAIASDYIYSQLIRTDIFTFRFPQPKRYQWLTNFVVKYNTKNAELQGSLLNTHISDKVVEGEAPQKLNVFSPTIAISTVLPGIENVRLRAFYKHIFRSPSFNDLYYTIIGNTSLKPEYATQYNLGATYQKSGTGFLKAMLVTVDAYFNNVKDKILAVPRDNIFQWTMKNIGRSQAKGADISVGALTSIKKNIDIRSRISYSYQQSLDLDESSAYYKLQLPYTPYHSGSVMLSGMYKNLELTYSAIASSYRYPLGDQIPENRLSGWHIHNINAGYNIFAKQLDYKLVFELNNFFNRQYQVIRYYPMPGVNFKIGITIKIR